MRTDRGHETGSVTVLALWSVAVIAALLAGAVFTIRGDLLATRNALAASEVRLAAEAGTQLGIARLLRRRSQGALVFDGAPELWRDGAARVAISIADEAGKIDLNVAPLELLQGLLAAIGRPHDEALLLACNILASRGDAGAPCPEPVGGARPGRFLAIEQLAQLPGFDDALYEKLAPYVTVATRASAIDPLVAARPVLLALPGATPDLVDAFLAERAQQRDLDGATDGFGMSAALPFVTVSPAREFTISALATIGRARYRAEELIRLTGTRGHPYEVLERRAPPPDRGGTSSLTVRPAP